jgi:hypothetical protein
MIVVILALYYFYWAYAGIMEAVAAGVLHPQPHSVRLTILELRNKLVPPAEGNPVTFGLLLGGCKLHHRNTTSSGSAVITFSSPQATNGYFFQIPAGRQAALDPVRWIVEAQADTGWKMVGASVQRSLGTFASFYPNLAHPMPTQADDEVQVVMDGRPFWPWILNDIGPYVCSGVGWSLSVWSGLMGRPRAVPGIMCCLFGCDTAVQTAAAVGFHLEGNWRASVEAWVYSAGNGVMALMLCMNERLVVPGLLSFGAILFFAVVRCIYKMGVSETQKIQQLIHTFLLLSAVCCPQSIVKNLKVFSFSHFQYARDRGKGCMICFFIFANACISSF